MLDLNLVFDQLARENLKVGFKKCVLAQYKVKVLGHLVSGNGIKTNPAKVEAIARMKPPIDAAGI